MRPVTEIVIHCTATRPEWWAGQSLAAKVAEVRLWHTRDRGWKDIGYHWLIDRDGRVMAGRPVEQIGAHVQGRNTGTIGIALFGGHGSAVTDPFARNFTPEQDRALRELIAALRQRFPAIHTISGHNQYAAKACPGFDVPTWLAARPAPQAADPLTTAPVGRTDPLAAFVSALSGLAALFRRKE